MKEINELIAETYGFDEINYVTRDKKIQVVNGVFDQQIINLKHHYTNLEIKGTVDLVDYSNLTHVVLGFKDIKFRKEFFRAFSRSYYLKKKSHVRNFYTLVYPWQKELINPTRFFWKTHQLDYEMLRSSSKLFLDRNIHLFPELQVINNVKPVVVICPPENFTFTQFQTWVEMNFQKLKQFSRNSILIKFHRNHINNFPDTFEYYSLKFTSLNSPLVNLIPTEILFIAHEKTIVITAPSSIMARLNNVLIIKNESLDQTFLNIKEKRDYGLLMKRLEETGAVQYF